MKVLVYQAYGREDILRQTLFSMVSLMSVMKLAEKHAADAPLDFQIWVYTDNKKMFADYFGGLAQGETAPIRIFEITGEQVKKWRGAIDFVHRVKVEILRDAAARFTGPIFYVDGDTYFTQDPSALFAQVDDKTSLMHIAENALNEGRDPLSKKIAKFVKKNRFQVGEAEVVLPPHTVMWNAGALGISQNNKKLLEDVLELTDRMYAVYPKHVMEQLAFSHVLASRTQLLDGEKIIGHYWSQKPEYQERIDAFLRVSTHWPAARVAYENFQHPPPAPPKIKKSFWPDWLRL